MKKTNLEQVGRALTLLRQGLRPFVEQRMGKDFDASLNWDTKRLLATLWDHWNTIFGKVLGRSERSMVSELRLVRNRWAHEEVFSPEDTYRAVDSAVRLLRAISAPQADGAEKLREETVHALSKSKVGVAKTIVRSTAIEKPTFGEVYKLLLRRGPGRAVGNKGAIYRIEAKDGNIIAFPRKGRILVCECCWLEGETHQGAWAGGIYNGP